MANTAVDWRIPTLYASSSDNIESEGIGALTGIISGKTINELNEFPTIEFRYDAHDDLAPYLTHDRIVVADVGPNQRNQMFRITEIDRHNADYVDVKGVHILGDLYYNAISPITLQNTNAVAALNAMKSSLADPMPLLKFQSDFETQINVNWTLENQQNAQYALGGANGSLLQILKGEYRFDNWLITYNKAIGQDLGQTIEYGKNLITVDQTDAMTDVYTAIQPYAWLQPETPEGGQQPPKVLLTLPEKVMKVDASSQFERLRIKTVDLSEYDVTDVASLRKVAEAYMSDNQFGIPNQSIKVDYAQMTDDLAFLETSNVGDRATVYFPQAQVNTKGEIQHTEWDWLIHEYTDTEIGWRKPTGGSMLDRYKKDTDTKVDDVNDKVDQETEDRKDADEQVKDDAAADAKEKADTAEKNANVRTSEKVQYGPNTPTNDAKEGDTWFKSADPLGTGYPTTWQMMVFRNGKWEEAFPAGYDKVGQQKIDDFKKTIDDAISAAGFDSAQELFKATSDNGKEITTIKANAKGLKTTVEDNERNAKSQFTQLSTLIDQRVTYGEMSTQISQGVTNGLARISLSVSGGGYLTMEGTGNSSQVYLGGSNVHIDGNTYIANGIIKSAMIDSLDAGKITGGDIRGLNAIYLNNGSGNAVMSPGAISTSGSLTIAGSSYLQGWVNISGDTHMFGGATIEGKVSVHSIWINGSVVEVSGGNLYINGNKKTS